MDKDEFKKIYKKYNEFDTLNDRFRFCMEVLKSCNCNEISKACDIPLTTVTRIRDGKIANPNPVYLYSIAMFFGVNYQWLVESKYFPFSRINNKYNCLTPDKNGLIDFHNLQKDSKSGIIFKDIDEYKKAFEAFIMYKDFIPILINCIDENKFLEKVENANFEKIIFQINFLNQVKKHNDNDMQQLARKVRNSIISYEKLMEMMNDFEKKNSSNHDEKKKD